MSAILDDTRLDWSLLDRFRFDRARFMAAADAIASEEVDTKSARIVGDIQPAPDVVDVAFDSSSEAARAAGVDALRAGAVAAVVLNGGMATRFGGVVKGTVEVYDGKSFLALKALDAAHAAKKWGAPVPLILMNSFATDGATAEHVDARDNLGLPKDDLLSFCQSISIRMNRDGSLFIGDDGEPSYHAPGHGDFFRSLRDAGLVDSLRARGVETVMFSNVDNLGATIDPVIIGHHLLAPGKMSAEVTAKRRTASGQWDKGGAPAVVDGQLQLVEGFRLPPDLPPTFLPDFSTNNFLFDLGALDDDIELARHVVEKKVDGRPALQLESIACEASAIYDDGTAKLPLTLLRVPREGPHGRFFPVKERVDLDALRDVIADRLETGWA